MVSLPIQPICCSINSIYLQCLIDSAHQFFLVILFQFSLGEIDLVFQGGFINGT